jgi:hypothetical protein
MPQNRSLSTTAELLDALETDRRIASIITELMKRCQKAGHESLGQWLIPANEKISKRETLRKELTEIAKSGWDFDGLYHPREAREFCLPEGGVLDLTLDELTEQQAKLYRIIVKFYWRWVDAKGEADGTS